MIASNPEMGRPRFISNREAGAPRGQSLLAKKPDVSHVPAEPKSVATEPEALPDFIRDPETKKLMVSEKFLNELQAKLLRFIGIGGTIGAVSIVALEAIAKMPH